MKKASIYFGLLLGIAFIFSQCQKDIGNEDNQGPILERNGISFEENYISFTDI